MPKGKKENGVLSDGFPPDGILDYEFCKRVAEAASCAGVIGVVVVKLPAKKGIRKDRKGDVVHLS